MEDRHTVYEVVPHVGVGPVHLGMSREEVRRVMPGPCEPYRKVPDAQHETDAFFNSGFQVFYGGELPVAEYIELSRESGFRVVYRGIDVFAASADDVVAHVSRDAAFDDADWELGYSYVFPDLDLGLWLRFARNRRRIWKAASSQRSEKESPGTTASTSDRGRGFHLNSMHVPHRITIFPSPPSH